MRIYKEHELIAAISLQESQRKQKLVDTMIMVNDHQNERVDAFYSKPWCTQVSHDYCPLVITLMSFVCLVSLALIIFICIRGSIECTPLRKFVRSMRRKFFKRTLSNASRLSYDRSIIPNSAMDLSTPINRSFFSQIDNYVSNDRDESQIWFTNINDPKPSATRPPPSYEESQTYTIRNLIKPVPINPVIRTFPHKESIPIANTVSVPQTTTVFPSYRCITLTSSANARENLNRLGDLSRQLLDEYSVDLDTPFTRVGTLNIHNDEVPPAYDSIIGNIFSQNGEVVMGTCQRSHQYISNEFLI